MRSRVADYQVPAVAPRALSYLCVTQRYCVSGWELADNWRCMLPDPCRHTAVSRAVLGGLTAFCSPDPIENRHIMESVWLEWNLRLEWYGGNMGRAGGVQGFSWRGNALQLLECYTNLTIISYISHDVELLQMIHCLCHTVWYTCQPNQHSGLDHPVYNVYLHESLHKAAFQRAQRNQTCHKWARLELQSTCNSQLHNIPYHIVWRSVTSVASPSRF